MFSNEDFGRIYIYIYIYMDIYIYTYIYIRLWKIIHILRNNSQGGDTLIRGAAC